jgi:lipocalin
MAVMNAGSVADRAWKRLEDVPVAISGEVMEGFVEEIAMDLQNYTGDTIAITNIPEKFQNIFVNLTAAYTVMRMHGLGADFDWSLGEFNVKKGGTASATDQAKFFLGQAQSGMKNLGRGISYYKALG